MSDVKKRGQDETTSDLLSILYLLSKICPVRNPATIERAIFLINYSSLRSTGRKVFAHRFFKGTHGLVSVDANEDLGELLLSKSVEFGESGEYEELLKKHGLTAINIVRSAKELLGMKK